VLDIETLLAAIPDSPPCGPNLEYDLLFKELERIAEGTPEQQLGALQLRDGDLFLLCTDGFWEYVEEADMERALATAAAPEVWLRQLEQLVVQRGRPGQDNYSALAVACCDPCVTLRM
jgi:serine/threonine protein phosphatase PrpC